MHADEKLTAQERQLWLNKDFVRGVGRSIGVECCRWGYSLAKSYSGPSMVLIKSRARSKPKKSINAPESWRKIAALHHELARQSANGTYFLGCRDAAKAHNSLNKDSANNINRALVSLGVVEFVRIGEARPGRNASEFGYLLPL